MKHADQAALIAGIHVIDVASPVLYPEVRIQTEDSPMHTQRPQFEIAYGIARTEGFDIHAKYVRTGSGGQPELVEECMRGREPPNVISAIGVDWGSVFKAGAYLQTACAYFTGGSGAQVKAGALRADSNGNYHMTGWCLLDINSGRSANFYVKPHCIVGGWGDWSSSFKS